MTGSTDQESIIERVLFWRQRMRQIGTRNFIRHELLATARWEPRSPERALVRGTLDRLRPAAEALAWLQVQLERGDDAPIMPEDLPGLLLAAQRARTAHHRDARADRARSKAARDASRAAHDRAWRAEHLPFLGRGVSAGLHYSGGDQSRIDERGLPKLTSAADIAAALGIQTRTLAWLTYHRGVDTIDHYHRFTIPKRTGGVRVIAAPKKQLRMAQRWVHDAILSRVAVHEAAMGFRAGRSIVQNAQQHANQAVVVRIDLTDFFPTISFRRAKGVFTSLGYNEGVATVLALLITAPPRAEAEFEGLKRFVAVGERRLPQGGCASPALTNVLCRTLDARLAGVARTLGFRYTRYADDLLFSHSSHDAPIGALVATVRRIVRKEGFEVNEAKTRVMRPKHRQVVTGLVVNAAAHPRVPRVAMRRFRAMIHQVERDGTDVVSRRLGQNAGSYASGFLAFVYQVDRGRAVTIGRGHPWIRPSRSREPKA